MQDRRRGEAGRQGRGRPSVGPHSEREGGGQGARDPKRDAGAYIGRMPERATETIPGGVGPKDERVSAVATQPAPVRGDVPATDRGAPPEGHREGANATDDQVREAGQNR